jgi:hypothetical protein
MLTWRGKHDSWLDDPWRSSEISGPDGVNLAVDRYDLLLQKLCVADWVRDFRRGRYLRNACIGDHMPAEWYTCPPALIPLTSNGSIPDYKGIWTRWFCDDTLRRYVTTGPEISFLLREIALTDQQFGAWQIVKAIVAQEFVDEAITSFGAASGQRDLALFDEHTMQFGDDDRHIAELPPFRNGVPAGLGEPLFQRCAITLPQPDLTLAQIAFFELTDGMRADLPRAKDVPPWMQPGAQVAVLFDGYLSRGQLREAWLTLNSTGWKVSRARRAALALAEAAHNDIFALQMKTWAEFSLDKVGFASDDQLSNAGDSLHDHSY